MIHDPISDSLVMIKNAIRAHKDEVVITGSKIKLEIMKILKKEGFIRDFRSITNDRNSSDIKIALKYYNGEPVINDIKRVSKPSRRIYVSIDDLPRVRNGMGIAILTTSRGIITDGQARKLGIGGEVLCTIM
jgi:small subunit ribosomal protein S8